MNRLPLLYAHSDRNQRKKKHKIKLYTYPKVIKIRKNKNLTYSNVDVQSSMWHR